MSCLLVDPVQPLPEPAAECAWADVQVGAQGVVRWPSVGISQEILLTRSRLELGVTEGPLTGRLVTMGVRSGAPEGYVGVDGESIVPQVQVAEARVDPGLGVRIAAGLLDDPWLIPAEQVWGLAALAPTLSEAAGWFDRSDLGLRAAWTSPGRWFGLSTQLHSGEGLTRRERNEGKDVTAVAVVRPIPAQPDLLVVSVVAREGSRGIGSARDHRLGARATSSGAQWAAGAEVDQAWGVGGDPERAPLGASAWAWATPWGPLLGVARADLVWELPGDADARRSEVWVAGGARWVTPHATGRLLAGAAFVEAGPAATALAGAEGLSQQQRALVLLDLRATAATHPEAP
jgi:hypothetical protein